MTTGENNGLLTRLREYWCYNRAEALRRQENWQEIIQGLFAGYARESGIVMDNKRLWKHYEEST